jgi:uncharacterized protein (TIGR00730 family)
VGSRVYLRVVRPQFGAAASLGSFQGTKDKFNRENRFMRDRRTANHHKAPMPHNGAKRRIVKPRRIRDVCVYCGSNAGGNPAYAEAARLLGRLMAEADIGLVYGGGSLGLMGEVARSVLASGGRVTGIIPGFLSKKERMLREAHEMIVVDDMHQRKKLMFDRSDAFVALPGGIGTLEELVEQLTWAQLGRHSKPVVLVNVEDFWRPFLDLLKHMRREGFIRQDMDVPFVAVDRPEDVLDAMHAVARPRRPQADVAVAQKF